LAEPVVSLPRLPHAAPSGIYLDTATAGELERHTIADLLERILQDRR